MTDTEIIKALECFAIDKDFDERHCIGCAFEHKFCTANMSVDIAKPSLDLINRQKAEIEKLRNANHILAILESEANTKVDELENDVEGMAQDIIMYKGIISGKTNECNKARAEAVKEFADILKRTIVQQERWINAMDIDEVLKEMVGDEND